ncbi:hypothetical protein M758_7G175900 [Ceratodon purpureus]|uniref:Secreted protein n=1 Tax=Ceratodon purpureus TaxID=3225 RepID=A0A8T0HCG9_CERPU|nr:hypothetical protein KC19_7G178800 [Ceratodon purpureus]KAG0611914.1 hypothetical protein M758_7G175900 [Ceratodon purpureus]
MLVILCSLVWHSCSWTWKVRTFVNPVPKCCGSVVEGVSSDTRGVFCPEHLVTVFCK